MNEKQTEKTPQKAPVPVIEGVVTTCAGSHIANVYKRVYNEKSKRNLVTKVDEVNIYEFIQASRSQTDLATLEKRFVQLGEIPCVDPTLGSNDLTVFPKDIHGVFAMVNDVNNSFKALPESIQAIFGTAENYQKALLDGSYQSILLKAIQEKSVPVTPTETEGEKNNE